MKFSGIAFVFEKSAAFRVRKSRESLYQIDASGVKAVLCAAFYRRGALHYVPVSTGVETYQNIIAQQAVCVVFILGDGEHGRLKHFAADGIVFCKKFINIKLALTRTRGQQDYD